MGLGYSNNLSNENASKKLNINFEINMWPFHHAFLKPRFVPFVGIQSEFIQLKNSEEGFTTNSSQQKLNFKTGLKFSYDRFIGSADYQFSANQVNFKILYAFFIRNRCVKKRIDEFNSIDISQF